LGKIGDNSNVAADLSPEHRRALLLNDWIPKIKRAEESQKALKAELAETYKLCKQELGYDKADIKFIMDLEGDHAEEVVEEIIGKVKIAQFMDHPLGAQLTLLDEPDRAPIEEKAEKEGYQAGLRGAVRNPPYDPSGTQAQSWFIGWDRGQEEVRDAFQRRMDAKLIKGDASNEDEAPDSEDVDPFDSALPNVGDDDADASQADELDPFTGFGETGTPDPTPVEDDIFALKDSFEGQASLAPSAPVSDEEDIPPALDRRRGRGKKVAPMQSFLDDIEKEPA
jgi:ribosome modulation factor/uncharacterized protein (UPF0335 family)